MSAEIVENSKVRFKICDGFDHIIDEKGSAFIALRKIQWGIGQNDEEDPEKVKLDLRKYYSTSEGERMSKGLSFLTEEGPGELVNVLVEQGYGKTTDVLSRLMNRDDFKDAVDQVVGNHEEDDEDDFYDPREVLFG